MNAEALLERGRELVDRPRMADLDLPELRELASPPLVV
jgi:hypothetical protein